MTQEELKTCLGQLLLDLRGNWAFSYTSRLKTAQQLCDQIEENTSSIESCIDVELRGEDGWDGRIFRGCLFYGYASEEGTTLEVIEWLNNNLTHPEYCELLN